MNIIHWFRQDLRLKDNPSFYHGAKKGQLLPLYIFDDHHSSKKPIGAASQCWLHHSLTQLNEQLENHLMIAKGDPLDIIPKLIKSHHIDAVYWNRCYEPWQQKRDHKLIEQLKDQGITVETYNGSLLWEPWEIQTKEGSHYKVFTPFYKKGCLNAMEPRTPLPKPQKISYVSHKKQMETIESLNLLPSLSWGKKIMDTWRVGETAAKKSLNTFIDDHLSHYDEGRNFPANQHISRLSPHLHWGEISPHEIWHAIKKLSQTNSTASFLSELGWREFSYNLLYHHQTLPYKNLQEKFNNFPWTNSKKMLAAWQQGLTGYPMVDAGMRELWQTGFMHNRLRMVTASFLVKNLLIHWHEGERWFWDCLLDADLANNSASWQWVAGCGADAAPFFRIFNPVTQGKKFDPTGEYIRRYVPELTHLPNKYLYAPWEAPESVLKEADITLGQTYPKPIVDLSQSRQYALDAYKDIK
ncbi:MAG: cryptochrome/photolyase family protein [Gammaproteobacteria bacterium]